MKREIKFRTWDKDRKEFVYISETDEGFWINDGISTTVMPNHSSNLEQLTGLKDRNGKEIYEGDIIIETIDDGSNKITQMYEVYWDIDMLCWSIKGVKGFNYNLHDDLWQTNSSREVIGNIHENLELLPGS